MIVDRPKTISATRSRTTAWTALPVLAILLLGAGCTNGIDLLGDGDHDVVPPADADGEVDVVGDAGVDADAGMDADVAFDADSDDDGGADVDVDAGTCAGGWLDPTSGLCWQDPPDGTRRNWDDAQAYCEGLALAGRDDWHLPTISELRSLVRGCPGTETGGLCGVIDSCFATCWNDACHGCEPEGGPGMEGAYWPPDLRGEVHVYLSSSSGDLPVDPVRGPSRYALDFRRGGVAAWYTFHERDVRCVRPGP